MWTRPIKEEVAVLIIKHTLWTSPKKQVDFTGGFKAAQMLRSAAQQHDSRAK
jgi:hypothetical protein